MKRSLLAAIPLLFVAGSLFAEVSGERPVSDPAYGLPPGQRYGTAAASDGRDFLVAWVDALRNRTNVNQIYATRMNAAGDILDPLGIHLPTLSNPIFQVDVVFLGENYLVYWNEVSPVTGQTTALMGVRINRDGIILDATPRLLADRAQVNLHGAASNSNRTVIVFGDSMIVLDRNANVIDGPRKISADSAGASNAMAASNGHDFLVVWQRVTTINSIRLDANGVAASSAATVTTSPFSQATLDLASDGDSYVTIIREGFSVVAQHIAATGELQEKSTVPLNSTFPGFAFTGDSYLLMDTDPQRTVGVRRLNRAGQPVGSYVVVADGRAFGAGGTLASNGSNAGVFWTDWATSVQLFQASVVNGQSLAASKPASIIRSAKAQMAPNAATSGRNNAVVWNEDDGLYAGRLSLDGQSLDGRGIRIGARSVAEPRIAYDGTSYLIGWIDRMETTPFTTTVKIARLSPDTGALLDPFGISIETKPLANAVCLTPGSSSTLVAWSDGQKILANTVSRDGMLGMPVTVTSPATINTGAVSAAWNGHEWLVTWEDFEQSVIPIDPVPLGRARIFAARLSSALSLLDPQPIVISNTLDPESGPLAASNGDGFLVAWSRSLYVPPYDGVFVQRISSDGSLLAQSGGVRLAAGSAKSATWDGLQYDVALTSHLPGGKVYNLFVTHVAATGSIESLNPLAVITNAIDPYASLLVTGTGRTTTVYTRVGTEPQYGDVERAFVSVPHLVRARASR